MLSAVKVNSVNCKETIGYLERRAQIEEEYAKSMSKLASFMHASAERGDIKTSTFGQAWIHLTSVTDDVAKNRAAFSKTISDISVELNNVRQDTDRGRKQLKDASQRQLRVLADAESQLNKAKHKFESCAEELDKARYSDSNGSSHRSSMFGKRKTEEDLMAKASTSADVYKMQMMAYAQLRQEYHSEHLPGFVKSLKDTNDECDLAVQALLLKYASTYEDALLADATIISPIGESEAHTLKNTLGDIDNGRDFQAFIQHSVFPTVASSENSYFGVSLSQLSRSSSAEYPVLAEKCIEAIENYGVNIPGLYQTNGSPAAVAKLRKLFSTDAKSVELHDSEWRLDIATVSTVLKMFLRELSDPVMTGAKYRSFVEAAETQPEISRLKKVHALVNELPDAHYILLKVITHHLRTISARHMSNKLTVPIVATIFAPILFGSYSGSTGEQEGNSNRLDHLTQQVQVLQVIMSGYTHIFEPAE